MPSSTTRWPSGFEQAGRLSRDGAIGGKAVGAAVERAAGIVADLRRKPRDVAARDIGRVGHDQIERPRQRRAEIARRKVRARVQARAAAALSRAVTSASRADVGADAGRVRQFGQERQQERARAGAEIGDAQRAAARPAFVDRGERCLDHGLGLRPRHQRGLETRSGRPQNSLPPTMRATGSRSSRRAAMRDQRRGLLVAEAAVGFDRRARCGRARAHGRSAGAHRARGCRGRRGGRRRSARGAPRVTVMPDASGDGRRLAQKCTSGRLRPPAARPDAPSPARR